jgi:hypothetical protein
MAMSASSSSEAGASMSAQPHQGRPTRNGRTRCGALMRSHTKAANLGARARVRLTGGACVPYSPAHPYHALEPAPADQRSCVLSRPVY